MLPPGNTVTDYNAVGAAAAYIHSAGKKTVYAYVYAEDVHHFVEKHRYRFRSFQYGDSAEYYPVTLFKIDRGILTYGSRNFYQLRFTIDAEPQPLRLGSLGQVELEVTE